MLQAKDDRARAKGVGYPVARGWDYGLCTCRKMGCQMKAEELGLKLLVLHLGRSIQSPTSDSQGLAPRARRANPERGLGRGPISIRPLDE